MKKISVVIPAYNQAQYLSDAINSVLNQSFQEFEIIVVDDGSTDETPIVVQQFEDQRIRYIRQENRGLSAARNTGIRNSYGEYLAFLDSDDMYLPDNLSSQITRLKEDSSLGMIIGGWRMIDQINQLEREEEPWIFKTDLSVNSWLFSCRMFINAILVHREWVEKINGFDEQFQQLADWDFGLRLSYAGCPMDWNKKIITHYRLHKSNMSYAAIAQKEEIIHVIEKFYSNNNLENELLEMKNLVYSTGFIRGAIREYNQGELDQAKADLSRAVQLDPSLLEQDGQQILDILIGYSGNIRVPDQKDYLIKSLNNLPDSVFILSKNIKEIFSDLYMKDFFEAYEKCDRNKAINSFLNAINYNPKWLFNWGVYSILFRSITGIYRD